MKDLSTFMFALGAIIVMLMIGLFVKTALVYFAWNYLVVAAWGAAEITFIQSLVLVVFVACLVPSPGVKVNDKKD